MGLTKYPVFRMDKFDEIIVYCYNQRSITQLTDRHSSYALLFLIPSGPLKVTCA